MAKSIINNDRECFICRDINDLHKHHIIHGTANRVLSEKHGLWVFLCGKHHNMSDEGVHFNHPFDVMLKKYAQRIWEEKNGDRTQFIKIFGKSYL
jgi:hypothetical protein